MLYKYNIYGKTLKLKGFIKNRTQNLFGMDWVIQPFEPTILFILL